jgi:hypothetical protein
MSWCLFSRLVKLLKVIKYLLFKHDFCINTNSSNLHKQSELDIAAEKGNLELVKRSFLEPALVCSALPRAGWLCTRLFDMIMKGCGVLAG